MAFQLEDWKSSAPVLWVYAEKDMIAQAKRLLWLTTTVVKCETSSDPAQQKSLGNRSDQRYEASLSKQSDRQALVTDCWICEVKSALVCSNSIWQGRFSSMKNPSRRFSKVCAGLNHFLAVDVRYEVGSRTQSTSASSLASCCHVSADYWQRYSRD